MLFDKIPGIVGSGVIPGRFKEIRETVKDTIMVTFFDREYLKGYMKNVRVPARDDVARPVTQPYRPLRSTCRRYSKASTWKERWRPSWQSQKSTKSSAIA